MITILTGCCDMQHPCPFWKSRPNGFAHFVLLIVKSPAEFYFADGSYQYSVPHAVLVSPGTPYQYGNRKEVYVNDWMHFDSEEAEKDTELMAICNHPFPVLNPHLYSTCIRQMLAELSRPEDPYYKENIECLFTVIRNHLLTEFREGSSGNVQPLFQQLTALRIEMGITLNQPHTARELAGKLNISESYFQSLYKKRFGLPFGQDLIQMRVEKAKDLISTTDLSLSTIALQTGYNNEIHFYRQFKKITGVTPATYRKHPHIL